MYFGANWTVWRVSVPLRGLGVFGGLASRYGRGWLTPSFRPLAGIRGIRRRGYHIRGTRVIRVSVPLRGLGVFGGVRTIEYGRPARPVSVPLRGLGVFGEDFQVSYELGQDLVSVPLRGLGVFGGDEVPKGTAVWLFVSVPLRGLGVFGVGRVAVLSCHMGACFRPLAGIRGIRSQRLWF